MVILLNGAINAGKTTIGQALADRYHFAHIEVDALRGFIDWLPLEHSIALNLRNAVAVARTFHDAGIDSVITYPLCRRDYESVMGMLGEAGIPAVAVALYPGLSELHRNRGKRQLTAWERSRIDELHAMGVADPAFGGTVDNAGQSVAETCEAVLATANRLLHQRK